MPRTALNLLKKHTQQKKHGTLLVAVRSILFLINTHICKVVMVLPSRVLQVVQGVQAFERVGYRIDCKINHNPLSGRLFPS